MRVRGLLCAAAILASNLVAAATFTVINTNDSGVGSLRQALTDANGSAGPDTIAFAIPGAGLHTINVASFLPTIDEQVTIDGYTQPGAAVGDVLPAFDEVAAAGRDAVRPDQVIDGVAFVTVIVTLAVAVV